MKLTSEQFNKLYDYLDSFQENNLSKEESLWLNDILGQYEEAEELFLQYMRFSANMQWSYGTVPGDVDYPEEKLILGEPPNPELLKTSSSNPSKKRRKKAKEVSFYSSQKTKITLWVIAPSLLLAVTIVSWMGIYHLTASFFNNTSKTPATIVVTPTLPVEQTPVTENVAVIKTISEGELRSQDILFVVNDHLKTGQQFFLEKGLLELEMNSGTEIIIAGPTTFQLLDSNKLRLLHGTITANVPQQAIGFTVNTPTMKVVDLGTQFGVHVNKEGTSEAHVFKGIVDCFVVKGKEIDLSPQRLTAGKSLKRQAGGELVQSDSKSEELFAKGLLQQAKIKNISGDLKFLPTMPPSLAISDFTDNDYINVFLERKNFTLPRDIKCAIANPDRNSEKPFIVTLIPQGSKVNVYYIHFDVPHLEDSEKNKTTNTKRGGGIRFKHKVLGTMFADQILLQTDQLFGNPSTQYTNGKSISLQNSRYAEEKYELSSDRRAMQLNWILAKGADAMRVIVAAEEK